MINKYEAKRDHLIVSLDGPVRPEESLDAVKKEVTVDSLARAFIRAAHVRTGGDANCATAIKDALRPTAGQSFLLLME